MLWRIIRLHITFYCDGVSLVETQDFASPEGVKVCLYVIYSLASVCDTVACETQGKSL